MSFNSLLTPLGGAEYPELVPVGAKCCDKCDEHFPLVEFDGKALCDPCIRSGHCKQCRRRMAIKGWDVCVPCQVAYYVAHPVEFLGAEPELKEGDEAEIARQVRARLPAGALYTLHNYTQMLREAAEAVA